MCLTAPLIASKPHFYDADPSLLSAVKGLEPDKEKHDTHADFDLVVIKNYQSRGYIGDSILKL